MTRESIMFVLHKSKACERFNKSFNNVMQQGIEKNDRNF